jgi:glucokinase
LLTPNLPGWDSLALARRLQQELEIEHAPAVCNDVRAGALAEARFGALRGVDPGVYVSLGTGIAAALTVGGTVLGGAHQAAGEIGYLNPGGTSAASFADGRAPLEEIVGGKALGARASELLGIELTAAELFERTDPPARKIVREALNVLGAAIANIAVFVDPERIVVGGGMMASTDVILPNLAAHLARAVPFAPQVLTAHFMQDASLHGAVALALDHMAGDRPGPAEERSAPTAFPADMVFNNRFACKDSG